MRSRISSSVPARFRRIHEAGANNCRRPPRDSPTYKRLLFDQNTTYVTRRGSFFKLPGLVQSPRLDQSLHQHPGNKKAPAPHGRRSFFSMLHPNKVKANRFLSRPKKRNGHYASQAASSITYSVVTCTPARLKVMLAEQYLVIESSIAFSTAVGSISFPFTVYTIFTSVYTIG